MSRKSLLFHLRFHGRIYKMGVQGPGGPPINMNLTYRFVIIIQYLCCPSIFFTFSDFLGGRLIKEMDIGNKNEADYI